MRHPFKLFSLVKRERDYAEIDHMAWQARFWWKTWAYTVTGLLCAWLVFSIVGYVAMRSLTKP